MSNVIQFCSKRSDPDRPGERRDLSTGIKSAALRASARDALSLLAGQFELAIEHARAINPEIEVLRVSARSGDGMAGWIDWLMQASARAARTDAAVPCHA